MIGWRRRLPRAGNRARVALLIFALALTACRTTVTGATDAADRAERWECLAFRPIRWSREDTRETIDQIAEHNAVWDALCREG